MDPGRLCRHASLCSLGAAAILFLYLNWKWNWVSSFTPVPPPPSSSSSSSSSPAAAASQWEEPGPYHVAYPRNYRYIMDDTPTCRAKTPFLVLMVHTATGDAAARDAIRETWGGEKLVLGRPVETVFVLGLPGGPGAERQQERLRRESRRHGDLIQSDFLDSYRNLTIKTMMMLEWLAARCGAASYAMKVDSDVLLHVRNAVRLLLAPGTAADGYLTGLVWWHSPVLRNPFNKFYMPRSAVAEAEYPPYPLGMAYLLSLDLPARILAVAPRLRPIFIEDAYLGMCMRLLGLRPTDPPEASMFLVAPGHPLSACSLSKAIAVTTTSAAQMRSYWERSRAPGAGC